jgi:hypothetical protein
MPRFVLTYIWCIVIASCKDDASTQLHPTDVLPNQVETLIKINALNDYLVNITSNEVASSLFNKVQENASTLKTLNPKHPLYLVYPKANSEDFLILTKNDSTLTINDAITSNILYSKILDGVYMASNNQNLLQRIQVNENTSDIKKLIQSSDENAVASLLFKNSSNNYSRLFLNPINDSLGYSVIDFTFGNSTLLYNGILSATESTSYYNAPFKNNTTQSLFSKAIAPKSTKSLLSIGYSDFSSFQNNSESLKQKEKDSVSFLNYTNEVSFLEFDTKNAIVFHSLNPELILEELIENNTETETFRDIPIYTFKNDSIFKTRFLPYFSLENINTFSAYKEFVVFSDAIETIKAIIAEATNDNTLQNLESFKSVSKQLSDASSMFVYKNEAGLSEVFKTSSYNTNAVQFINDGNISYMNGIISNYKKRKATHSVLELFNISIENEAIIAPQLLKNHINNHYDIAVQDVNNVLYLISNSGQILWRRQLQGKILGNIEQLDCNKNRRLQLAFATENRVYVIDRNGKDVNNFPKKFNDEITQPLSVFDYDNKRNYRLLVTQGANLLIYDAKGKMVNGFKYTPTETVTTQPKHFRINSKDYIVFSTKDKLRILNRRGTIRVNVKESIQFSENSIFNHSNKFTSTNSLGQLIQVSTKGTVSRKNLNLTDKHLVDASSKTLTTLVDNTLTIRSKKIDLDFGEYTAPKIFYLKDKIYVTTTDVQAKKVYLFDSQAKPIKNFPVYGTSEATLADIDNDTTLELVTLSDNDTIITYKLN